MFFRIWRSARRIGLRDKGYLEPNKRTVWTHASCSTRLRVGIDAQGEAVHYCWRCERVMDDSILEDPKEKEPVQPPVRKQSGDGVVVSFPPKEPA